MAAAFVAAATAIAFVAAVRAAATFAAAALAARPRCRRLPSPLACRCRSSSYLYDYGTRYICEHLRWSPAPVLSHLALVRVAREFV